jgi:hypothetical protein
MIKTLSTTRLKRRFFKAAKDTLDSHLQQGLRGLSSKILHEELAGFGMAILNVKF